MRFKKLSSTRQFALALGVVSLFGVYAGSQNVILKPPCVNALTSQENEIKYDSNVKLFKVEKITVEVAECGDSKIQLVKNNEKIKSDVRQIDSRRYEITPENLYAGETYNIYSY